MKKEKQDLFIKIVFFISLIGLFLIDLHAKMTQLSQEIQWDNQKYKVTVISNCNQVIKNPYMRICYSCKYSAPVFNFYKLKYKDLDHNLKKRLTFKNDKRIQCGYTSIKSYVKSGYDKGHLAPDASFDFDEKILSRTYLNSNILPEVPYLNRYIISQVERKFRDFAIKNKTDVLVITGGYNFKYNSKLNFYVPQRIFKILIYKKIRLIYDFPNTKEYWDNWKKLRKKDLKKKTTDELLKIFEKNKINSNVLLKIIIRRNNGKYESNKPSKIYR